MESKIKVAGHPLHPILIVFPLGLLATAVGFDIVYLVSDNVRWSEMSFVLIGVGVVTGLTAAAAGWVDWFAIPAGTRAKRVGLAHGVGNVILLGLFALSWVLRRDNPAVPPTEAVAAGLIGGMLSVITGWLGGELVDRLGVGVDDGAHLDAPSSLTALPAGHGLGAKPRAAAPSRWSGPERRVQPIAAYAGVERRGRPGGQ